MHFFSHFPTKKAACLISKSLITLQI